MTHRVARELPGVDARRARDDGEDVLLSVTTLSFDIAGLELYLPLVVGGRVVLASREEATDGERLKTTFCSDSRYLCSS